MPPSTKSAPPSGLSKAAGGGPPEAAVPFSDPGFGAELAGLVAAAQSESVRSLASIQEMNAALESTGATPVLAKAPGAVAKSKPVPPWRKRLKQPVLPPWRRKRPAPPPPAPESASEDPSGEPKVPPAVPAAPPAKPSAPPQKRSPAPTSLASVAATWLRRGGRRLKAAVARINSAATLAEEYFTHATPPAKRRRVELPTHFAPQLLEKAPETLQTCRSLLLFLDRKLESPAPPAPAVGGPADLRSRLEVHADGIGRLDALRSRTGWDARAKRVFDIAAVASSLAGEGLLGGAKERLEKSATELERELKERGEGNLETFTKERFAWVREQTRRDWMAWCAKLLRVREGALLAEADSSEAATNVPNAASLAKTVDATNILEALLTGGAGLKPSGVVMLPIRAKAHTAKAGGAKAKGAK